MFKNIINYIRFLVIISMFSGFALLAIEAYYIVTNSNRPDFFPYDGEPQDMSSGLFSAYSHEENENFENMKAKGSILIDFDLDGDQDLYYGFEKSFYFINRNGHFEDATLDFNIDTIGCNGIVAGDVDNNGFPDLIKYRPSDSHPHQILLNDGNHIFTTRNYLPIDELPYIHSQGLLDADLDGDLDLIAIQEDGQNQFFLYLNQGLDNTGTPEFEQAFVYDRPDDRSTSRILAIADYDNDGDQDIYIARKYDINWLFENQTLTGEPGNVIYNSNPDPFFIERAAELGIADPDISQEDGSQGYGAAWGDYDNDEDFDLYLTNWGKNRLFRNEYNYFENMAESYKLESDSLSNGAAWGDFNNDGLLDLWSANIKKHDDLYINLGDNEWDSTYSPIFLSATQDVISVDYNNDGWLDIFAAGLKMIDGPPGAKFSSLLYKNVTTDETFSNNNWLKIRLEGSKNNLFNQEWSDKSNRSAIGARVVVHLPGQNLMREIIGGKGHGNMDPLELHFGLNNYNEVEGISIYWPSRDINTNQRKITYIDGPVFSNESYVYVEDLGFVGKKGDLDLNEESNILDIIILVNHVIGSTEFTPEIIWAADFNYSNSLNILDIIRLVNFILFH